MKKHIGIFGTDFSGAVLARELAESGRYRVTVFDQNKYIGGASHTYRDEETGVLIHSHGPQVFCTNDEKTWEYVNFWGRFENFTNRIKAHTKEGIFTLPVNLLTLNQFYHRKMGPQEARDFVGSLSSSSSKEAKTAEEVGINFLGQKFYDNFIYGYLKKLWGEEPSKLSPKNIKLFPIRFNYDDNFSEKKYQGIPVSGYSEILKRILDHQDIEVRLGHVFDPEIKRDFDHLFWSGPMDGFFNHRLGKLGYRSHHYERIVTTGDFQGNAILYYCDEETPYTKSIEYKHLTPWEDHELTVCYKEFSKIAEEHDFLHHPLNRHEDEVLLGKYQECIQAEEKVTFIGSLGTYRNLSIDQSIKEAKELAKIWITKTY